MTPLRSLFRLSFLAAACLLLGACGTAVDEEFTIRLEQSGHDTDGTNGRWSYTLETSRAGTLEVSLVDVRRPDDGPAVSLDLVAGEPAALVFDVPSKPRPWSSPDERPHLDYSLAVGQGERQAVDEGELPEALLPDTFLGGTGPKTLESTGGPGGDIVCPFGAPLVLVSWNLVAEAPDEPVAYGTIETGIVGAAGADFTVPETVVHGEPVPVADYGGALWQLRLRLTPR